MMGKKVVTYYGCDNPDCDFETTVRAGRIITFPIVYYYAASESSPTRTDFCYPCARKIVPKLIRKRWADKDKEES